ncbi:MAG: hypothetical protein LBQ87_03585, partial [Candidatus Fibromonas sp.]|nr:hypothetical protein [Candidatus Fibromonas sp.]
SVSRFIQRGDYGFSEKYGCLQSFRLKNVVFNKSIKKGNQKAAGQTVAVLPSDGVLGIPLKTKPLEVLHCQALTSPKALAWWIERGKIPH